MVNNQGVLNVLPAPVRKCKNQNDGPAERINWKKNSRRWKLNWHRMHWCSNTEDKNNKHYLQPRWTCQWHVYHPCIEVPSLLGKILFQGPWFSSFFISSSTFVQSHDRGWLVLVPWSLLVYICCVPSDISGIARYVSFWKIQLLVISGTPVSNGLPKLGVQ